MVKVILTGATGFIGAEVLVRLIQHPDVAHITCLSRRAPAQTSPKLSWIQHDDFSHYDAAPLDRMTEHAACIWTLGGRASDAETPESYTRITHGYTLALAQALAERAQGPFTFCYLSGMGADPNERARLPWEKLTRHVKGRTERDLCSLQARYPQFCVHNFRPGGVLPDERWLQRALFAPIVVSARELADAMIHAAITPALFRQAPLVDNASIKRLAHSTAA